MKRILCAGLLLGILSIARAQTPNPQTYEALFVRHVGSAPTGACSGNLSQFVRPTNQLCSCISGTWSCATAGGGGSGDMLATVYDTNSDGTVNRADLAFLAAALSANGANCSAGTFPLGVDASGAAEGCSSSLSGNASTATALAANGGNCAAGTFPLGVDASGAAESCSSALSGNAATASALAADGTNASSGFACAGVDAAGNCQTAGTFSGPAGGTGRTTNPQHQIVYGGSSNAQTSSPGFTFDTNEVIITHSTLANCTASLQPGTLALSSDPSCTIPADTISSQKDLVIGSSVGSVSIATYGAGEAMSFANAEGIGMLIENAQTTVSALVSNSGTLTNADIQASTLIAPNSTGSLPAVEVTPGALYVSYATTPATIYTARDTNSDGTADTWEPSGTNAAPPGSNKNVPFNNSGAYGADSGFEYDPTLNQLSTQGPVVAGSAVADGGRGIEAGQNTVNPGATTSGRYRFHFMGDEAYGLSSSGSTPGVLFANVGNEYTSGDLTLTEATGRKVDYQVKANVLGTAEIDETQQFTWTTRQTFSKTGGGASGGTGDGDGAIWLTGADAYIRGPNDGKLRLAVEDASCGGTCTDMRLTMDAGNGTIGFTGGAVVSADGGFSTSATVAAGAVTGTSGSFSGTVSGNAVSSTTDVTANGTVTGATGTFGTALNAGGNVSLGTILTDVGLTAGKGRYYSFTNPFTAKMREINTNNVFNTVQDHSWGWCWNCDTGGGRDNTSEAMVNYSMEFTYYPAPATHVTEYNWDMITPAGSAFRPFAYFLNVTNTPTASFTFKTSPSTSDFTIDPTAVHVGTPVNSGSPFEVTGSIYSTGSHIFEGSTADANQTTLAVADPSADRTVTLPNETGTVCTTGSVCSGYQATDIELTSIAGLTSAADKFPYYTGSGTAALADLSSGMRTFLTTPSSANLATVLSDEVGTSKLQFGIVGNWTTTRNTASTASTDDVITSLSSFNATDSGFTALRAGSVTGLSINANVTTAGTGTSVFGVYVNTSTTAVFTCSLVVSGTGWQQCQATQAMGVDTFSAGDTIWVAMDNATSSTYGSAGTWTGVATGIMALVEVMY